MLNFSRTSILRTQLNLSLRAQQSCQANSYYQRIRWLTSKNSSWGRVTHRIFTLHRTRTTVTVHITQPTYTHWTPWGSVKALHKHSVFGKKQTSFTNSLLQDISIFMGYGVTLLEDWLVDIETAADLMTESRTKLAQTKSKSLTCTLITEAVTSGKSWEDTKDLLWLKICNSDIHTSICCSLEIPQCIHPLF